MYRATARAEKRDGRPACGRHGQDGHDTSGGSGTLTNNGTGALTLTNLTIGGNFAFATTGTSCPYTGGVVASGTTCTIDVTFTPSATGTRTGLVTLTMFTAARRPSP